MDRSHFTERKTKTQRGVRNQVASGRATAGTQAAGPRDCVLCRPAIPDGPGANPGSALGENAQLSTGLLKSPGPKLGRRCLLNEPCTPWNWPQGFLEVCTIFRLLSKL